MVAHLSRKNGSRTDRKERNRGPDGTGGSMNPTKIRHASQGERVGTCGCLLERSAGGLAMKDCPLHATALELLDACMEAWQATGEAAIGACSKEKLLRANALCRAAIAKAEGREHE